MTRANLRSPRRIGFGGDGADSQGTGTIGKVGRNEPLYFWLVTSYVLRATPKKSAQHRFANGEVAEWLKAAVC